MVLYSFSVPSASNPWLLLVFSLPSKNGSVRVDIWRKLKRSGALALPTSGYLLPNSSENLERFEWLSAEIRKHKGQASVALVQSFDDLPHERLVHLFVRERNKDYEKLLRELKAKRTEQQLSALRRKLLEISAIDFFDSPMKRKVEGAMAALQERQSGKKGTNMKDRQHSNRIWITRHRPGIDRCSSAWLIQRFIDPKARFAFGNKPEDQPDAIAFDMYGESGFGHRGDHCTFETLCAEFSLRDPRLKDIAEIVHDADLHDEKFGRPEGAALDRVLKGWAHQQIPDDDLIRRGMELFEGLYEGLSAPTKSPR
jgi:hypothetical protein